jgi:hypothetical protein
VDTFFDAGIEYLLWPTLPIARKQAAIEASDTGGLAVAVQSVEIGEEQVSFLGRLPSGLLVGEPAGCGRLKVKPIGIGRFHCAWVSLIQPRGCVGYIVLQPPFRILAKLDTDVPERPMAIACQFVRTVRTFSTGTIVGARLCRVCNEPIPASRISALPGTHVCVLCKQKEERI